MRLAKWIAWHVAALSRSKKLPKFAEFSADAAARKGIDEDALKAFFKGYQNRLQQKRKG
jgi:hypothetical protein